MRFSESDKLRKESEAKVSALENELYKKTAAFEAVRADGLLMKQVNLSIHSVLDGRENGTEVCYTARNIESMTAGLDINAAERIGSVFIFY